MADDTCYWIHHLSSLHCGNRHIMATPYRQGHRSNPRDRSWSRRAAMQAALLVWSVPFHSDVAQRDVFRTWVVLWSRSTGGGFWTVASRIPKFKDSASPSRSSVWIRWTRWSFHTPELFSGWRNRPENYACKNRTLFLQEGYCLLKELAEKNEKAGYCSPSASFSWNLRPALLLIQSHR